MRKVGLEPLYVLELTWPAVDEDSEPTTLYFSDAEFTAEESPFGKEIHEHVEAFGQYSSVAKTDGFGSLESVEITLNDSFGLFKHTLENYNIYDLVGRLWLVVKQPPAKPVVTTMLYGRVSDPIEWDEPNRTIKLGFITNVIFNEFGFLPDWTEHDYLNRNLTGRPWPHVFGTSGTYRFEPICKCPAAQVAQGIIVQSPGDDGLFYPYDDTDEYTIYQEGTPFLNILANNLGAFPHFNEGASYYQMTIPGGRVIFKARNLGGALNMTSAADWNIPNFANIAVWSPQQYNGLLPYQQDARSYIANTIELIGYGSLNQISGFNIFGELVGWPGDVDVPFPLIGFNADQEPWLRGQYIYFTAFRTYTQVNDVRQVKYIKLWARVIEQNGLTLILDEVTDEEGLEFSLSGYRPCFIHYSAMNKVFRPSAANALCGGGSTDVGGNSQSRWPESPVRVQRGHRQSGSYIPRPDNSGFFDRVYEIQKGADIKPIAWWANMVYPISLDLVTDIQSVGVQVGNRLIPLNISHFVILRYNKQAGIDAEDVTAAWEVLTGGLSGPPWVPPVLWGMNHEFLPDECLLIVLRPTVFNMMLRDLASTDVAQLLVTCSNDLNTDEKVFKFIVEKYTTMDAILGDDEYYHHPMQCMIQRNEPVPSIVGRLAWEHLKTIKLQNNVASLVDSLKPFDTILPRFNESNIEFGALKLAYTPENEIKNRIEATPMDSWTEGRFIVKDKDSIRRLTEIITQVEIGMNRIFTDLTNDATNPPDPLNNSHWENLPDSLARGYNRALYFWLHDYCNVWLTVQFNTFIPAIVPNDSRLLVGSDLVTIDFQSALDFITADKGLPLNVAPVYRTGSLPQANGMITEISINPSDWSVSIAVKLPIKLGSNVPQYVVEE